MNKDDVRNLVKKRDKKCKHNWMIASYRKTEHSSSAAQLVCRYCLDVMSFNELSEVSSENQP